MKVSSITGNTIESNLYTDQQAQPVLPSLQRHVASIGNMLNRIGTSIAIGESGDLDAAHEFRIKSSRLAK